MLTPLQAFHKKLRPYVQEKLDIPIRIEDTPYDGLVHKHIYMFGTQVNVNTKLFTSLHQCAPFHPDTGMSVFLILHEVGHIYLLPDNAAKNYLKYSDNMDILDAWVDRFEYLEEEHDNISIQDLADTPDMTEYLLQDISYLARVPSELKEVMAQFLQWYPPHVANSAAERKRFWGPTSNRPTHSCFADETITFKEAVQKQFGAELWQSTVRPFFLYAYMHADILANKVAIEIIKRVDLDPSEFVTNSRLAFNGKAREVLDTLESESCPSHRLLTQLGILPLP